MLATESELTRRSRATHRCIAAATAATSLLAAPLAAQQAAPRSAPITDVR